MGNQCTGSRSGGALWRLLGALCVCLVVLGCSQAKAGDQTAPTDPLVGKVLVVVNQASSQSVEIGEYYAKLRHIPKGNVLRIQCPNREEITQDDFDRAIKAPIKKALVGKDYIVLTRGVPIRISSRDGYSVDALLSGMDLKVEPLANLNAHQDLSAWRNPFFLSRDAFSAAKYGMYIVTRLDGYSVSQIKRLVDNSVGARASNGPFFVNKARNRTEGGYGVVQQYLDQTYYSLNSRGYRVILEEDRFRSPGAPVMGYASWGSNDSTFRIAEYRRIRFQPGALAQTYVSTSGRTFRSVEGGQSLIADLIAQGVTGVVGYVSEPYAFSLARPDYIFQRYVNGANLGESFYSSIPIVKWKEVVIGDPLARPYAKQD